MNVIEGYEYSDTYLLRDNNATELSSGAYIHFVTNDRIVYIIGMWMVDKEDPINSDCNV